jgi:hypothetical protein
MWPETCIFVVQCPWRAFRKQKALPRPTASGIGSLRREPIGMTGSPFHYFQHFPHYILHTYYPQCSLTLPPPNFSSLSLSLFIKDRKIKFMIPSGLRPEKDSAGDAQQQMETTDPTSRQRGRPTSTNPQLCKRLVKEKGEKLVAGPRWAPDTKIDWPTDRRS